MSQTEYDRAELAAALEQLERCRFSLRCLLCYFPATNEIDPEAPASLKRTDVARARALVYPDRANLELAAAAITTQELKPGAFVPAWPRYGDAELLEKAGRVLDLARVGAATLRAGSAPGFCSADLLDELEASERMGRRYAPTTEEKPK